MTIRYVLLGNAGAALRFMEDTPNPPERHVLTAPERQRMGEELRATAKLRGIPCEAW